MTLSSINHTRSDTRGDLRKIDLTLRTAARRLPDPVEHSAQTETPGRLTTAHQYWSGLCWQLGAAAYWEHIASEAQPVEHYSLGNTLIEEVVACLLGGYGVSASTGEAAFTRLVELGFLNSPTVVDAVRIEAALNEPLTVDGRLRRYRFPVQRARRVADAMRMLDGVDEPADDLAFRDWLLRIPGIGPKTASWVVRNRRGSAQVAVIDIHIVRAGTAAGVFPRYWNVAKHYRLYEHAFLQWAGHAGIHPAHLDACIWAKLAYQSRFARDILGVGTLGELPVPVWPVDTCGGSRVEGQ